MRFTKATVARGLSLATVGLATGLASAAAAQDYRAFDNTYYNVIQTCTGDLNFSKELFAKIEVTEQGFASILIVDKGGVLEIVYEGVMTETNTVFETDACAALADGFPFEYEEELTITDDEKEEVRLGAKTSVMEARALSIFSLGDVNNYDCTYTFTERDEINKLSDPIPACVSNAS